MLGTHSAVGGSAPPTPHPAGLGMVSVRWPLDCRVMCTTQSAVHGAEISTSSFAVPFAAPMVAVTTCSPVVTALQAEATHEPSGAIDNVASGIGPRSLPAASRPVMV